ncbi:MAG: ABC transporter permease [Bacillota bacterium]
MVKFVLLKKLYRTIWQIKGQFFSLVAVVALGITTYICMSTTYYNLEVCKKIFYQECNFADYYFQVIRAPEQVVAQIERVPGVTMVNGRIVKDVSLIKQDRQKAKVRIVSYQFPEEKKINRLHMFSGRMFEDSASASQLTAIVDSQFAAANNLTSGSTLNVLSNGKAVPLTVIGTATSPEFTYPVKDIATMLNDPTSFGVVTLPHKQAQGLLDMEGQINSIIIRISPGSDENRIKESIKAILLPYGYQGEYPQKDQSSNSYINSQLDQLGAETRVIPTLFLIVAAAIQFIMLGRMIKMQRLQIGIMKALGYKNYQIIWYYTSYALVIGFLGTVIGIGLGFLLSIYLTNVYLWFYNLPHYSYNISLSLTVKALVIGMGAGLLSGWLATRRIVKISPAESMRPEPPTQGRKIIFEQWTAFWQRLEPSWKMTLRGIGRNRMRFWVTVMGVSFAVGLLVVAMFFNDSINYSRQMAFYTEQKSDLTAKFAQPVEINEAAQLSGIHGVAVAEPVLEVPVRISANHKFSDVILIGYYPDSRLKTIEGVDGQRLSIPGEGITVSRKTAEKLGIGVGDQVQIETKLGIGENHISSCRVMGISRQVAGKNSAASLDTVNKMLQEHNLITGVMLKTDPGLYDKVEREISDIPGVYDIVSREKEVENFNRNMDSIRTSVWILTGFAILLGCAIIFNSSLISFGERQRELATLRVVGMKSLEIAAVLRNEVILQCLLGLLAGFPLGRLMAEGVARIVSGEVYELQAVVSLQTYTISTFLTMAFVFAGYLIAVRGIKNLDFLEILKNRD